MATATVGKPAEQIKSEASQRMKDYWAKRRADKVLEAKEVTEGKLRPPKPARLDVLERRLVNPQTYGSTKITLNIPGDWTLRWVNTAVRSGRFSEAVDNQGWEPVQVKELKSKRQIPDYIESADGFVTRGDRGAEVLMRMPTAYYEKIQRKKVELNRKKSTGKNLKQMLVDRAAARDPELAEAASRAFSEIQGGTERIQLDPNDVPQNELVEE